MKVKVFHILSSIFFGIFVAPIVSLVWALIPGLRYFPVGDDSPHAIGLPLGFCIGLVLGHVMNRRFRWGLPGLAFGALILGVSTGCAAAAYSNAKQIPGWDGLGWVLGFFAYLHGVLSGLGLLLSALFAHLCPQRMIDQREYE